MKQTRDPEMLKVRPCVDVLPMLADHDPQFLQLLASVRAEGVRDEITIDQEGLVVDGRHRVKAARLENRDTVPIVQKHFDNDQEALAFAVARLFERRHYTDSARAYTIAKMEGPTLLKAGKAKRLANLKMGQIPQESPMAGNPTIGDEKGRVRERMARVHGFSRDRWNQAVFLLGLFEDHPQFVIEFEPQILSGEKNLGWVICAIQGRVTPENNKGRSDSRVSVHDSLMDIVEAATFRFKNYFPKLRSASQRMQIAEKVADEFVEVWPEEVCKSVEKKLKERKAARQ